MIRRGFAPAGTPELRGEAGAYPLMSRACELVALNQINLLPHLVLDLERFDHHRAQGWWSRGDRICALLQRTLVAQAPGGAPHHVCR